MTMDREQTDLHEGAINAPFIVEYIRELLPPEDGRMAEMVRDAEERYIPIVQPEVARWLQVFMKARPFYRVLEIGTAIGYSTSILAAGLPEGGRLDTIEIRQEHYEKAQENIAALGLENRVVQHLGDAADVLPGLEGPFDLVFMDGAKGQYRKFLEMIEPKLAPGAIILSDNVLFRGMIANSELVKRRKRTIVKRMRTFMDYLMTEGPYDTALLPLGDGMAMSVYKGEKVEGKG
jgi:predicted O-methyltransferase YrrM